MEHDKSDQELYQEQLRQEEEQRQAAKAAFKKKLTMLDKLFYIASLMVVTISLSMVQFSSLPEINASVEKTGSHTFERSIGKGKTKLVTLEGEELVSMRDKIEMQKNILAVSILAIVAGLIIILRSYKNRDRAGYIYALLILLCHGTGIILLGWNDYTSFRFSDALQIAFFASLAPMFLVLMHFFNKDDSGTMVG